MQASRTDKYEQMREMLNEKQWRHYLALEAKERGSVMQIAREAGVSHNTVRQGLRELEAGERYSPVDRQRKEGGGRKHVAEKDASLRADLESLLEPKGDPMSLLKWTTKSVAHLQETLEQMGHKVAETTIRRMLHGLGYSLRGNKKNIEGTSPLTSLEVVLELISHTAINEGLTVTALSDSNTYPTGVKVSDEELAALHLLRDAFHGEWNYTILPQSAPSSDDSLR